MSGCVVLSCWMGSNHCFYYFLLVTDDKVDEKLESDDVLLENSFPNLPGVCPCPYMSSHKTPGN